MRRRRPGLGAAAAGLSERPLSTGFQNTGAQGAGDIAASVQAGDKRALARVISWVENGDERARSVLRDLKPPRARTRVIGLTGAPGAGKSTVTSALVRAFRARVDQEGQRSRVAVLAVDPSSPFTGGALLGDRIRMQEHATDDGVFIRSMGSRGQLGGLAAATPQAIRVLSAAGYQVILVETVGVGQAEVEIASAADSTVVLVVPGMGLVAFGRRLKSLTLGFRSVLDATLDVDTYLREHPLDVPLLVPEVALELENRAAQ